MSALVIAGVIAIATAILRGSDGLPDSSTDVRAPRLATSLEVRNARLTKTEPITDRPRTRAVDEASRLVDAEQPAIYVNVRNDGELGAAVDRVRLVVRDTLDIPDCERSGGPSDVRTWRRGITVPAGLKVQDAVETDRRVIASVRADDAVSFDLRVRPSQELVDQGFQAEITTLYRFQVDLRVVTGGRWIKAGDALVALPDVPVGDFDDTVTVPVIADCTSRNVRRLQDIVRRSPKGVEISALLRKCLRGCSYSDAPITS